METIKGKIIDGYFAPQTKVEQITDRFGNNLSDLLAQAGSEDAGRVVPLVNIISSRLTVDKNTNTIYPLTTAKNPIPADEEFHEDTIVTFVGNGISFTDQIIIAYQGQATLGNPKKGFTIDLKNKHKFGEWLEFDSFHLKGYYQDWEHIRDTTANRLYEQMLLTHAIDNIRPYMAYNDFDNDIRQRIDAGAYCHVDGFPCELYINGEFWGIYTWRLKKDKGVYMMKKENHKHIMLDTDWVGGSFSSFPWTTTEIRYPKGLKNMDGTKYDGDNPQEIQSSECKTNILAFFNALFVNPSTLTKDDFEDVLNVQTMIDIICHHDFCCIWDSIVKNTLYGTWDGTHWSALPYDMDSCFGIFGHDHTTWVPQIVQPTFNVFSHQATQLPWFNRFVTLYANDIAARYAELRNKGIFTTKNVMDIMQSWINQVGFDLYERDTKRWDYPTNGGNYPGAIKDSIKRVSDFVDGRIVYLDDKYNYSTL